MRSVAVVIGLLASAFSGAALAAEPQVSMTIYNSNLALVEDVRTLDMAAGRQRLEFKDVSASIRPETVSLQAPGMTIVEQNFDYDLLSPDKLMEKAVGREVKIVRTNPGTGAQTTETATVLAVNDGVVLKIGDRIEVLRDDGLPTRVIFDKVPDNLRANPTLSVTVDAAGAGPRQARLSYLTKGLSWKADYVAVFDEKAGKLDFQGWITLTNTSGTSFRNAETRLVAGQVNLADSIDDYYSRRAQRRRAAASAPTGSAGQSARAFADYYIYPLAERTTIADNQTKQVGFIEAGGVTARKVYKYLAESFRTTEPAHAEVVVELSNAGEAGFATELPAGVVRVYARDAAGEPRFIGEDAIAHTPQGSQLDLTTGEAFDITVQPTLTANEKVGPRRNRHSMKYVLRNARDTPAQVELNQYGLWRADKVIEESQPSRRLDAATLVWNVDVPAQGETTLTFTVERDW